MVVTNPPYSEDHFQRLLRFCHSNAKPYLLLLPNYVCGKDYYLPCVTGSSRKAAASAAPRRQEPQYLCPRRRYNYWTPKGLRDRNEMNKHGHSSELGHRTSPFLSFWYIDLTPVLSHAEVEASWRRAVPAAGDRCTLHKTRADLPSAVRPSAVARGW